MGRCSAASDGASLSCPQRSIKARRRRLDSQSTWAMAITAVTVSMRLTGGADEIGLSAYAKTPETGSSSALDALKAVLRRTAGPAGARVCSPPGGLQEGS